MFVQNFTIRVSGYIALIALLAGLLSFLLLQGQTFFAPLVTAIGLFFVAYSLLRYLHRATRELTHFVLTVKEGIFSEGFRRRTDEYQGQFTHILREIGHEFSKVAMEKELHYQYLKTLNEVINTGIVAAHHDGRVQTINETAKNVLRVSRLSNLNELKSLSAEIFSCFVNLVPGEKTVLNCIIDGEQVQLSLEMKQLKVQDEHYRIYFFQDITSELQRKEGEAWEQLTHVLTHEIMNSVTPIVSLTKSLQTILGQQQFNPSHEGPWPDVRQSIDTISARSEGLIKFVTRYKSLTKEWQLKLERVNLLEILERTRLLLLPEFDDRRIVLELSASSSFIAVEVDRPLIEQAVINVLKNALEAVNGRPSPRVDIVLNDGESSSLVEIRDNGPGIELESLDKIFVPFYSTKTRGSGIGLSLVRKIMTLHKGSVKVRSVPGEGACFILEFRKSHL